MEVIIYKIKLVYDPKCTSGGGPGDEIGKVVLQAQGLRVHANLLRSLGHACSEDSGRPTRPPAPPAHY